MTRHTREDALTEREFELLLEGATQCKQSLKARFVVLVGGRLGLRAGEIAHMKDDWVDWRQHMVSIPRHESCDKGRFEGEVCGYCRQQAEQMLEHHDDMTLEEAEAEMWSPKN